MNQREIKQIRIASKNSDEKENINIIFQKIAKGTILTFIGTVIGVLLGFVSRIVIVRLISQSEYGVYSLALVLVGIFATLSTLGLHEGATRYIAYFRGKNEKEKVDNIISWSIKISIITGSSIAILTFIASDYISASIFHILDLSIPLKIFSITIPFTVLINIFTAIFRGFESVKPRIYFQNILRNLTLIVFLIIFIYLGLSFFGVVYAYLLSVLSTFLAFIFYYIRKLPIYHKKLNHINTKLLGKKLLLFSLPLMGMSFLIMTMSWTDTLMLGYFKTPALVGLYNAAIPLVHLITIAISAIGFIYIPITSQLFSKNRIGELRKSYQISTKWSFMGSFIIFFAFFLFPEKILYLFFGSSYITAAFVLQILAIGHLFDPFFGLNFHTLITTGHTNFLMKCFLIISIINIIANSFLIPIFDINGAAIATASSFCIIEIIMTIKLYKTYGVHPFTHKYKKLIGLSILLLIIFYGIKELFIIEFWLIFIIIPIFLLIYFLLILFTHTFDKEDIMIILALEKRLGLNLTFIKKFLKNY